MANDDVKRLEAEVKRLEAELKGTKEHYEKQVKELETTIDRITKPKKKKSNSAYYKVAAACVAVVCILGALAFLFGDGGFGLGDGFGGIGGRGGDSNNGGSHYAGQNDVNGEETTSTETDTAGQETEDNEYDPEQDPEDDTTVVEPPVLVIRVVSNTIYHGEQEVTIDELVQIFDEINQPGLTWELRDEQAIMETFANVRALMNEHGILFTER